MQFDGFQAKGEAEVEILHRPEAEPKQPTETAGFVRLCFQQFLYDQTFCRCFGTVNEARRGADEVTIAVVFCVVCRRHSIVGDVEVRATAALAEAHCTRWTVVASPAWSGGRRHQLTVSLGKFGDEPHNALMDIVVERRIQRLERCFDRSRAFVNADKRALWDAGLLLFGGHRVALRFRCCLTPHAARRSVRLLFGSWRRVAVIDVCAATYTLPVRRHRDTHSKIHH